MALRDPKQQKLLGGKVALVHKEVDTDSLAKLGLQAVKECTTDTAEPGVGCDGEADKAEAALL